MPAPRVGVVYDMPASVYYADPCETPSLTQSIAHELVSRSPAHAWLLHPRLGGQKREPTKAMDEGSVLDALLLGNDHSFFEVVADDYKTKGARELRDSARAAGKTPILSRELAGLRETAKVVRRRLRDAGVRLDGDSQVAAFWIEIADDGTEVPCRALFDHLVIEPFVIYDLKKSRTAHPKSLARHVEGYGYDIQAAAYLSALGACWPASRGRARFEWLFCEAEEPYAVTRAEPAGSMLALGRDRWMRAVNEWARCMKAGYWPAYETAGLVRVEATPWSLENAAFDREGSMGDGSAAEAANV